MPLTQSLLAGASLFSWSAGKAPGLVARLYFSCPSCRQFSSAQSLFQRIVVVQAASQCHGDPRLVPFRLHCLHSLFALCRRRTTTTAIGNRHTLKTRQKQTRQRQIPGRYKETRQAEGDAIKPSTAQQTARHSHRDTQCLSAHEQQHTHTLGAKYPHELATYFPRLPGGSGLISLVFHTSRSFARVAPVVPLLTEAERGLKNRRRSAEAHLCFSLCAKENLSTLLNPSSLLFSGVGRQKVPEPGQSMWAFPKIRHCWEACHQTYRPQSLPEVCAVGSPLASSL